MLSAVRVSQRRVDLVGEDVFGERFADRQIETRESQTRTGAGRVRFHRFHSKLKLVYSIPSQRPVQPVL